MESPLKLEPPAVMSSCFLFSISKPFMLALKLWLFSNHSFKPPPFFYPSVHAVCSIKSCRRFMRSFPFFGKTFSRLQPQECFICYVNFLEYFTNSFTEYFSWKHSITHSSIYKKCSLHKKKSVGRKSLVELSNEGQHIMFLQLASACELNSGHMLYILQPAP